LSPERRSAKAAFAEQAGAEVFAHRAELGATQAQLAQQLGTSPKTISRWESGTCEPSAHLLYELRRLVAEQRRQLDKAVPMRHEARA
jgi:DNA-binding XRE family transcriptional regulator